MSSEKQRKDSALPSTPLVPKCSEKAAYFLAEVSIMPQGPDKEVHHCLQYKLVCLFDFVLQATHPFNAASEKELSLSVGDYVVVRQVRNLFFFYLL